ncbi:NfeD family protein [Lysobacter sp. HDW10]|uniref:NfeD family protein n=1 Tax=Lysobacter sp. HDW10 TaxID=2714936 RepID=UPI001407C72C|nr:NfeD family protein [Lysobacter sp. HDW10]QIK81125.1 NfeD family protein [Lysobacter sp. HDW10]
MRPELIAWAVIALSLMAAEAFAPGAFLIWLGFAAAIVFVVLLIAPLPIVAQVTIFVVLGFVFAVVYRKYFRKDKAPTDQPGLNRRAETLVGQVLHVPGGIRDGLGKVQIADALWNVRGADVAEGARVRVVRTDGMELFVEPE